MRRLPLVTALAVALLLLLRALWPEPIVEDEAALAGLSTADFPQLAVDAFAEMDQGAELSDAAIRGRNTWILWTGGSQRFLDWLAREGYGISDILKMLDSRNRDRRFETLGLMNEPGFETPDTPDKHGLWLDVPLYGGQGRTDALIETAGIDERVYGRSTGVLGLRLFPNPDFDDEAAERWDAAAFYTNDEYSRDPDLVRPYRIGMTCGLCHIAPNPLNPPADPERPRWENLVSLIGNQYFREGRVFASNLKAPTPDSGELSSFLFEMLEAQLPGTSDTSRMATDHINNPNAVNAIFNVGARLAAARANPSAREELGAANRDLPGTDANDGFVPHILKDGADSVGLAAAALRVYVNIGTFSEYWLTLHRPIAGVEYQRPFEVAYAQEHSVYWRATEERMGDLAEFFKSVAPYRLEDARWVDGNGNEHSGRDLLTDDAELLLEGQLAFARNCARCHSSKQPQGVDSRSEEASRWFEEEIQADDFLDDNFLSDDRRHSISYVETNACRALATNAKRGRIWDNFSSETYKSLPAVQAITIYDPFTHEDNALDWSLEERGVRHSLGYYRTPSLIGLWSSAPFLHNNALGTYTGKPSVRGRLNAFYDAARKLLWPERRDGLESIWRTERDSWLQVPVNYLPGRARIAVVATGLAERGDNGINYLRIGPVPAGTPINLLASLDASLGSLEDWKKVPKLIRLVGAIQDALATIEEEELAGPEAYAHLSRTVLPSLMANNKCPDLVEDRGHTFGADLPDAEKWALIEFLKTL